MKASLPIDKKQIRPRDTISGFLQGRPTTKKIEQKAVPRQGPRGLVNIRSRAELPHKLPRYGRTHTCKPRPVLERYGTNACLTSHHFYLSGHPQECPEITYLAMGFRPHSFPVGGMYVKGIGLLTKVKKIACFSFPLLLKRESASQNLHVYLSGKEKPVREAQH